MDTAELFETPEGQVVRLPKGYRLPGKQVGVKRVGTAIMLVPENTGWQPLFDSLSKFDADFMADRNQPPQQHRPELFD
jgi:antitoxin VapB